MASLINTYFAQNQHPSEQSLLNRLNKEAIKIMGRTYYYIPRDSMVRDKVLGEDALSAFSMAIPLEMYMSDAGGFTGQKELFTKFGLQINNSYKIVLSVDRWNEEVKSQFDGNLANGEALFNKPNYVRPWEGDLIYDPLTKFLMAIKFVDHDEAFYQLGKNYVYTLSCEAFLYQNEPINTGVPEIDAFDNLSMDLLNYQFITEDNLGAILSEDGGYLLQEDQPNPIRSNNEEFSIPAAKINAKIKTAFD